MRKSEKTVFISYRRANSFHALAVFQSLLAQGYDVFIDFNSIDVGQFNDIIFKEIEKRTHFIVILTPSALDRCYDDHDWVRREILCAMERKRNIVPLTFDGFDWRDDIIKMLPEDLRGLAEYNVLDIPKSFRYFHTAMSFLMNDFLDNPSSYSYMNENSDTSDEIYQKIELAKRQPPVTRTQLEASYHFEQGKYYYFNGLYKEAISEYTESLRLNSHNPVAYYQRGICYERVNPSSLSKADYHRAIEQALADISHNIYDYEAHYILGMALDSDKKYDEALPAFDEAIKYHKRYSNAYNGRGWTYINLCNYESAIKDFNKAIEINPNYANAYYNRGIAYLRIGNYQQAVSNFDNALKINPNYTNAYYQRGLAYLRMNDYENARKNLRDAQLHQFRYDTLIQKVINNIKSYG